MNINVHQEAKGGKELREGEDPRTKIKKLKQKWDGTLEMAEIEKEISNGMSDRESGIKIRRGTKMRIIKFSLK